MKNRHEKQGGALILAMIFILVVGLAAFYHYSDVFKTKVDEAARQAREWTPENIQKDPVGYLTWARAECDRSQATLEARRLAINTRINEARRTITANEAEIRTYQDLLEEAKTLFRTASEVGSWPADLRGASLSEEQLKRKIVEAYQRVERDTKVTAAYKSSLATYERQLAEIQTKLEDLAQLKHKLTTDLEVARVKQTTEGIEGIAQRINAITDTSTALAGLPEEPSIEDLAKPGPQARLDETFDAIMTR